tara:strand:+ start:129 stop:1394 length:1266 start_codon:yes stop_codon:yes gene_type:complete
VSAVGLASLNYYLDMNIIPRDYTFYPTFFYYANPDNIRTFLSVCASSILGVAGVTFSITIASLTLASQQYGPRLLRNFMQDRFNQTVLGIFIATFLYSVSVLQFTSSMEVEGVRPIISMTTLMVLMIIDLLALVFFIHHIAMSIQADAIINSVNAELRDCIVSFFPDELDDTSHFPKAPTEQLQETIDTHRRLVVAKRSGYLQVINYDGLMSVANEHNIVIKCLVKAGGFIMHGVHLAEYVGQDSDEIEGLDALIHDAFVTGKTQTPIQDPEFAIRQLVEVAVRALSPGINDPYTAISCIDKLGDNIAFLMHRHFPSSQRFDEEGRLKLQLKHVDFQGVVDVSFNQIRQHGKSDTAVTIRLLETLLSLSLQVRNTEQAVVIMAQADAINSVSITSQGAEKDRKDTESIYQGVSTNLHEYLD